MYAIYSTPYLDTIHKCYYNILIIEPEPIDKLLQMVKRIKVNNLTSTSNYNNCLSTLDCVYAFKSIKNANNIMKIDELSYLFNKLNIEGFIINTDLTKMIIQTGIQQNKKKLLCYLNDGNN